MLLDYHGRPVPLEELRRAVPVGEQGTTALALVLAARRFGLTARGRRLMSAASLAGIPLPAILHWSGNHYVVVESYQRAVASIVDPLIGRREIPLKRLRWQLVGSAVLVLTRPRDVASP